MKFSWFENPPSISPSATPALGVGLCFNTMLLLLVYVLVEKLATHPSEVVQEARQSLVFLYSTMVLAPCFMYGLAAAAWTGWSWWRLPFATIFACILGWSFNMLVISLWSEFSSWPLQESFQWGEPSRRLLILLSIGSFLGVLAVWSTLFARRDSPSTPM